jgi:hypothetical protein
VAQISLGDEDVSMRASLDDFRLIDFRAQAFPSVDSGLKPNGDRS